MIARECFIVTNDCGARKNKQTELQQIDTAQNCKTANGRGYKAHKAPQEAQTRGTVNRYKTAPIFLSPSCIFFDIKYFVSIYYNKYNILCTACRFYFCPILHTLHNSQMPFLYILHKCKVKMLYRGKNVVIYLISYIFIYLSILLYTSAF